MTLADQIARRDPQALESWLAPTASVTDVDAAVQESIRLGAWDWVKALVVAPAIVSNPQAVYIESLCAGWVVQAVRSHGSEQARQVWQQCAHPSTRSYPLPVPTILRHAVDLGSLHAFSEIKGWPEMKEASWLSIAIGALKGGSESAHRVMFKEVWPRLRGTEPAEAFESGFRHGRYAWLVGPFRSLLPSTRVALSVALMARLMKARQPGWEQRFWKAIDRHPGKLQDGLSEFKGQVTAGVLELAQEGRTEAWRRLLPRMEASLLWDVLPAAIERRLDDFAEALWDQVSAPTASPALAQVPPSTCNKALSRALAGDRLDWCDRLWSPRLIEGMGSYEQWNLLLETTALALPWLAPRLDWDRLGAVRPDHEPLNPKVRAHLDQALVWAPDPVRQAWLDRDSAERWPLAAARQEADHRHRSALEAAPTRPLRPSARPRS